MFPSFSIVVTFLFAIFCYQFRNTKNFHFNMYRFTRRFASSGKIPKPENTFTPEPSTIFGLDTKMLFTRAWQSAALWGAGDFLSQVVTNHQASAARRLEEVKSGTRSADEKGQRPSFGQMFQMWDKLRTAKGAFFGAFIFTPGAMRFYSSLDKIFPGKGVQAVLSTYFTTMSLLDGQPETIYDKVFVILPGSLVTNWMVWGPVQLCNFFILPQKYWIVVVNLVSVPWAGYMAYKNNKARWWEFIRFSDVCSFLTKSFLS